MKKRSLIFLCLLIASFMVVSCATKQAVVKEEKPAVEEKKPEEPKVEVKEPISPAPAEVEAMAPEEIAVSSDLDATFDDVHFDFDKYDIRKEDEGTLNELADWMIRNMTTSVTIEGHCDERGTNEYNLALGERRATAIENFLTANGVDRDRLSTISYGEERPFDNGHNEDAWARNRRGHFVINR